MQYFQEKLSRGFSKIRPDKAKLLFKFSYIFITEKKSLPPKIHIYENNLALHFFPDFEPEIGQQHFFIICPGGQTPIHLFFMNIYQNFFTARRPQRMAHFLKEWFFWRMDFRVFLKDGFCWQAVIKISLKDCMAD